VVKSSASLAGPIMVGLPAVVGSIALTLNESLLLLIILSDLKSSIVRRGSNLQGMKSKIEKKSECCGSKLGKFTNKATFPFQKRVNILTY
jgi:hypothetical protein